MRTYNGTVCTGRGKAAAELAGFSGLGTTIFGHTLVPGSLNVLLDRPIVLETDKRTAVGEKNRSLWKVAINGVPALAYRWAGCPLHIIEIVSHLRLREHLALADDSRVALDFSSELVRELDLAQKLSWAALWKWREAAHYNNDSYVRLTKKVPRLRKLAGQPIPA